MKLTITHEAQWGTLTKGTLGGQKPTWHICIAGYEACVWPDENRWGWAVYDMVSKKIGSGFVGTKACACDCAEAEIHNHARRVTAA